MPSNHLILCRPLLLLPSIFPSIRVFTNESALHIRWPEYWSFSFNISQDSSKSPNPGLFPKPHERPVSSAERAGADTHGRAGRCSAAAVNRLSANGQANGGRWGAHRPQGRAVWGPREGRTRSGEGRQTRGPSPHKELPARRLAHRRPWRRTRRSSSGFCIPDISREPVQVGRATRGRRCVIIRVTKRTS